MQTIVAVQPDNLIAQKNALLDYIGLGAYHTAPDPDSFSPTPLYFIERAPVGGKSRCSECLKPIASDTYRVTEYIALTRNLRTRKSGRRTTTSHVSCFEKTKDFFSKPEDFRRIIPVTKSTWAVRNIMDTRLDERTICAGGVERLLTEWKLFKQSWFDMNVGEEVTCAMGRLGDIWSHAGSSESKRPEYWSAIDEQDWKLWLTDLAPYESNGPDDTEQWNLFETFFNQDNGTLQYPFTLSGMLKKWEDYAVSDLVPIP
ncbi:hypothetical protein D0Z07_8214 [Hyphodiscus hymeniophilus]|uniref:PARP-type domain-containing protein n=1 Tax=Hyphodiscus hymeniophilus TaxID=353542 RepID=A0A9P6SQZ6_9HELO|nr:hypothetical protein D0Z07_8214 [Hyphodiscus hymeniophilus]